MKKSLQKVPNNPNYKNIHYRNLKKQRNSKNHGIFMQKGLFGVLVLEDFKLTFNEVEAIRKCISFNYKKTKIWFNVEFNIPLRSKSSDSRMGKGVGKLKNWVCNVRKGSILLEIDCLPKVLAFKIFKIVATKLQVKTLLISR